MQIKIYILINTLCSVDWQRLTLRPAVSVWLSETTPSLPARVFRSGMNEVCGSSPRRFNDVFKILYTIQFHNLYTIWVGMACFLCVRAWGPSLSWHRSDLPASVIWWRLITSLIFYIKRSLAILKIQVCLLSSDQNGGWRCSSEVCAHLAKSKSCPQPSTWQKCKN